MSEYRERLREAIGVFQSLEDLEPALLNAAALCIEALRNGHKLLLCGNGGSTAEAQHLAGELMGNYTEHRAPLAAVSLTADSSVLTCIANDYGFDEIFARQVRALGQPGDVLVVFSTSGNSPNIVAALQAARQLDVKTIAFLGRDGGKAAALTDCPVTVRHTDTARIQEAHQFLMHALMDEIEKAQLPSRVQRERFV